MEERNFSALVAVEEARRIRSEGIAHGAPDGVGDGGDGGLEVPPCQHDQLAQRGALDEVADGAVELLIQVLVAEDGPGEVVEGCLGPLTDGVQLGAGELDDLGGGGYHLTPHHPTFHSQPRQPPSTPSPAASPMSPSSAPLEPPPAAAGAA